jgi:L-threonylcarbamoyladenylate synthase
VPVTSGQEEIDAAVRSLSAEGVVAFPTDTLYGLGADVFSLPALERVISIKGRPPGLALPVLVSGWDQVGMVARDVPEAARLLARRFWPGPLTLVLAGLAHLPEPVTGGGDTVAVRMPAHWVPVALAGKLGRPITGTSANRSGEPDLLTVAAVEEQLGGRVDYIIRAGPTPKGTPSTVVDVTGGKPRLVRQGALPFEDVMAAWGRGIGR